MSGAIIPLSAGWRGRSVPLWPVLRGESRPFSRDGRKNGREAEFVGSPIARDARHATDIRPRIPYSSRGRPSTKRKTAHEILHGENLRVRAAFPLIATRGNRPFSSRGGRGPWTMQPRIDSPPISPSSSSSSFLYSILFHRRRVLPFVPLPSCSDPRSFRAPLSLSFALSWIRSYLMYGTPPSSAGRTLVRLVFDADHSPLSCGSARFPPTNLVWSSVCACIRGPSTDGRGENSLSRLQILPVGIYVRAVHRGKCFYGAAEGRVY